jgi:hypothetical protein
MRERAEEAAVRAGLGALLVFVGACLVVSAPVALVRGFARRPSL